LPNGNPTAGAAQKKIAFNPTTLPVVSTGLSLDTKFV
jgi:hypothetical protein